MQVENVIAFVKEQEPAGLEIRVNFGIFAGRDATAAELDELGKLLVPEAGEVSIVGEQRHEISEEAEITRSASPYHRRTCRVISASGRNSASGS
jgi:hypothetical protein